MANVLPLNREAKALRPVDTDTEQMKKRLHTSPAFIIILYLTQIKQALLDLGLRQAPKISNLIKVH